VDTARTTAAAASLTKRARGARLCSLAVAVLGTAIVAAGALGAPDRAVFRTPAFPTGLAPAFGSIWITTHRGGVVYRIDPKTNRQTASVSVADAACGDPVVAAGALWVSGCDLGEGSLNGFSYGIDPKTNAVIRRIPGQFPVSGAGSIWTVRSRTMYRVDPRSGVVLATIHVPGANAGAPSYEWKIAGAADGSVWALTEKTLVRVSTATNTVTNVIPLPGLENAVFAMGFIGPSYLAALGGKVWVAQYPGLYEIDPTTNVATYTGVAVGPFEQWGDAPVIAANGSLWVRTTDKQVVQLGPDLQVQHRFPVDIGGGGGSIAVAFGSLWVDNAGENTTSREPLK
jgi:hypothetical protein